MGRRYETISLVTDYGTTDEFVGVLKAVIRDLAPHVGVIDLSHDIAPHDVRAGSLLLARCVQYLPEGVVVAVVDPGVGTTRRAIAVEVGDGAGVLVGPDNGLLAPAVALAGEATRAVELTEERFHLPAPGATFAESDVFAPVAAQLCLGTDLEEVGALVDPIGLFPGVVTLPRREGPVLHADVLWVDRYGNAQLNVGPDEVDDLGERLTLALHGQRRTAVRVPTYAAIGPGRLGLVVDSYGMVSIAVERGSAADLGLAAGDAVDLTAGDDDGPATATRTPVAAPSRRSS